MIRTFTMCILLGCELCDQVKEDEIAGECSTRGRDEKRIHSFGLKFKEKRSLIRLGIEIYIK